MSAGFSDKAVGHRRRRPRMMTSPRWIIFDAADTLLRPNPSVAEVYHDVAAKHDVAMSVAEIRAQFGPAIRRQFADEISNEVVDRQRWRALVFDVLRTDKTQIFEELWEHFARPASWELFDDVEPTWNYLNEAGFRLAIASNFDARLLNIVQANPILASTRQVFLSSQLGYRKPSRRFFAEIETRLACDASELTLVGDSRVADFEGARNAGWNAFHLVRDQDATSPFVISSLLKLRSLARN